MTRLRERLFELSKKNQLLYFQPSAGMLDLTAASSLTDPILDENSICAWRGDVERRLSSGRSLSLFEYIDFEKALYARSVLARLRAEHRKSQREYGFSQLRLVPAFLRWNALEGPPEDQIVSPLLLLPVELDGKSPGDRWRLKPLSTTAEVNPALRQHLHNSFGLTLPEEVELSETTIAELHSQLATDLGALDAGLTLRPLEQPSLPIIRQRARERLEGYRRRTGQLTDPLGHHRIPASSPHSGTALEVPPGTDRSARGGSGPSEARSAVVPETSAPAEPSFDPRAWELDLSAVTLGMFNSRKMSLVRDFSELIERAPTAHPTFDALFSDAPRAPAPEVPTSSAEDSHFVVRADATQKAAVLLARSGDSYVIQGPPGTGKSQTITNLIADQVARGKRVLFVCAKRAAIDVVYHRLKAHGLEDLCTLIHDSQGDKKAFIQELRATYDARLGTEDRFAEHQAERLRHTRSIARAVAQLTRFDDGMRQVSRRHGMAPRQMLSRAIELREAAVNVPAEVAETLPTLLELAAGKDALTRLEEALEYHRIPASGRHAGTSVERLGESSCFGLHPLRVLGPAVILSERPVLELGARTDAVRACLRDLRSAITLQQPAASAASARSTSLAEALASSDLSDLVTPATSIAILRSLTEYAGTLEALSARDQLTLLDPDHPRAVELERLAAERARLTEVAARTGETVTHWKDKLPRGDVDDALALAERLERNVLRFFSPAFWRLRRLLEERYELSAHAVPPSWVRILAELRAHYDAEDELILADESFATGFGGGSAPELLRAVIAARAARDRAGQQPFVGAEDAASRDALQRAFRARLLAREGDRRTIRALLGIRPGFQALLQALDPLVVDADVLTVGELEDVLELLATQTNVLADVHPELAELVRRAPVLHRAAAALPWRARTLEAAIVGNAVEGVYREDRGLRRADGAQLERWAQRLAEAGDAQRKANARVVAARVHSDFASAAERSRLPATSPAMKEWKKRYARGRRELEHELGKVMRYKSIRALAAGDTGLVLRDLKPIWLMSPLSVSDTLPLDPDAFDVVIFDEASQIPLEEAIPALFRARQAIVVGDEMQLPPTDFFSSRQRSSEEDDESEAGFQTDAESFLTRAARALPSSQLGWHYRSRSESLIDFSNVCFYGGTLRTVPDPARLSAHAPIIVTDASDGVLHAAHVLDRPVGFHFLERGLYEDRTNVPEAAYVAQLVRGLLAKGERHSIGVVAFSEAQQTEIEAALSALADEDDNFRERLETEWEREEDEQFVGLFVKNLENVQGDERDIVILSVAYGPNAEGRVRMGFGPINRSGGERRLNVVFSRAKRHIVVVSSIRAEAITNDHNDGAACLKRYLRYVEALSVGDAKSALRVLDAAAERPASERAVASDPMLDDLAGVLEAEGYRVDRALGHSTFRCDLVIRADGEARYRLAILVDTEAHYAIDDVTEKYVTRPAILETFDWKVTRVLAKDWHEDREAVLRRLIRLAGPLS